MQPQDLPANVVDQLPVGVFAFTADGHVLLWNSRAERLTGWNRARVGRAGLAGLPVDGPTARRIRTCRREASAHARACRRRSCFRTAVRA